MKIEYLGHSCFLLTTSAGQTVLTDPYTGVGYELPANITADIVTVSHGHFDHNYVAAVQNKATILTETGKQVVDGIVFEGIASDHDPARGTLRGKNTIFKMQADGITLCHLGDLGEPLNNSLVEKIGKVDILFIPVGGNYTIDAVEAKRYVDAIAPKTVIPMHYRPIDGSIDIATETAFLRLYESYEQREGVYNCDAQKQTVFMTRRKI